MSEKDALKTKRHHKTREEEADRDLNHTSYSKGAQALLTGIFLAFVFGVPIAQSVSEYRQNVAKQKAWDPQSGQPKPGLAPKAFEVFGLLPTGKQISQAKGFWGYWDLIPSTESIEGFEKEIKESSILTQAFLSPAQQVLTGTLGVGNEKAYCGRDGWLFYRPDVDYLTADGFLNPDVLKARSHGVTAIQPDPIKAILDMKTQLAKRGIALVVLPMPTKPMIHPEMLVGPSAEGASLQNPSFDRFVSTLQQNGVQVFDPTSFLLDRKRSAKQYLETDTHWTPDAMEAVAERLAGAIAPNLPAIANPGYTLRPVSVSNLGDIAEMLKLPKDQKIYKPQAVTTHQVVQPDGSLWTSRRDADVLLLGDSFSNIFSLKGMNWGEASGFAEHLSYRLGRPIDKIVINAGGAFASRRELFRQMQREDRLAGKKVVVYEFSMRDLSQGDWKMIQFPAAKPKPAPTPVPPDVVPPKPEATHLKVLGVEPSAFDPTKGESVTIRYGVPKGTFAATVVDASGKKVKALGGGAAEVEGEAKALWDGKGEDGKPVKPGAYKVVVSGKLANGTAEPEVSTGVLVTGSASEAKLEPIGATPERIDAVAKQTTTADFSVPAAGSYSADVLGANEKPVRRLGKQNAKPGVLHVKWDGSDASGKPAADGTYKVRLRSSDAKQPPVEVQVVVKSKPKAPTKPGGEPKPPAKNEPNVITGRILARAPAPQPGAYKDALIAIEITDIKALSGTVRNGPVVVYVWGMRDNKLVDGAYRVGQTVTLKLVPFSQVEGTYGSYNRQELEDDSTASLPTFWGETKR